MTELHWEVSDLESVPEAIRESYKQGEDGKYRLGGLKLPNGQSVENLPGLLQAHENIRSEKTEAERRMKEFGDKLKAYVDEEGNDLDPNAVRDAMRRIKSGQVKDSGEVEKAVEAARKQAAEEFSGKLKATSEQNEKLRETVSGLLIDSEAVKAAGKTTCPGEVATMLVRKFAKVEETSDGTHRVVILNNDGQPRISTREASSGDVMSVEEFVQDVLPRDFPDFFPNKAAGGNPSGNSSTKRGNKAAGLRSAALLRHAMASQSGGNQGR